MHLFCHFVIIVCVCHFVVIIVCYFVVIIFVIVRYICVILLYVCIFIVCHFIVYFCRFLAVVFLSFSHSARVAVSGADLESPKNVIILTARESFFQPYCLSFAFRVFALLCRFDAFFAFARLGVILKYILFHFPNQNDNNMTKNDSNILTQIPNDKPER